MQNKKQSLSIFQRQLDLEKEMLENARNKIAIIYQTAKDKKRESVTLYGQSIMRTQLTIIADKIKLFLDEANSGKAGRRHIAVKYLNLFSDMKVISFITLKSIIDSLTSRQTLLSLTLKIANAVYQEYKLSEFEKANPELYHLMHHIVKTHHEQHKANAMSVAMSRNNIDVEEWSKQDKIQLGSKLLDIFMETTGFIEIAGESSIKGTVTNYVVPTEKCLEFVKRTEDFAGSTPEYLPTIIPPKKWTNVFDGGYYAKVRELWLVKARFNPRAYLEELNNQEMPTVYNAVNAVQNTSWRVNKRVYDVLKELWEKQNLIPNKKGNYLTNEDEPLPVCPVCKCQVEVGMHDCFGNPDNKEAFKKWKRQSTQVYTDNISKRSKRLTVIRLLKLAERFIEEEKIYFPQQLDYRGRMYSVPSYLSPQGQDWGKGLLEFADAKPLQSIESVKWLAIHGANVYGQDKLSLDDRFAWVLENEDNIKAVSEDPVHNTFWQKADKPTQFLAFCFEWSDYIDACNNGAVFYSRLPIAMDGSCNGSQIYSLLLRDEDGAKATNVIPSGDKPSDIYQIVADKVIEKLKIMQDIGQIRYTKTGAISYDEKTLSRYLLELGINRSATKKQVMTVVYAATFDSCKTYTLEWLKEALQEKPDNELNMLYDAQTLRYPANFLAELIWQSMRETIVKAYEGMEYLQAIAGIVSKEQLPIYWTTPTGFKVLQAKKEEKDIEVKTQIGTRIKMILKEETPKISVSKQKLSVAPNFIHSLDASAMMKTIEKAVNKGITHFAMIHDSYGTHASDAPLLAEILREAFVEMFSDNILLNWTNETLQVLPRQEDGKKKITIPELPVFGTLDLKQVLKSLYFFA